VPPLDTCGGQEMGREAEGLVMTFEEWHGPGDDFTKPEHTVLMRIAWNAAINVALRTKAPKPKPKTLQQVGTGALYGEQSFCYEKGWKEGIAAYRKTIREKVNGND
jgi:hypothetical protein